MTNWNKRKLPQVKEPIGQIRDGDPLFPIFIGIVIGVIALLLLGVI